MVLQNYFTETGTTTALKSCSILTKLDQERINVICKSIDIFLSQPNNRGKKLFYVNQLIYFYRSLTIEANIFFNHKLVCVRTSTTTNTITTLTAVMSLGNSFCTSGFIPINALFVITAITLINSKAAWKSVV